MPNQCVDGGPTKGHGSHQRPKAVQPEGIIPSVLQACKENV